MGTNISKSLKSPHSFWLMTAFCWLIGCMPMSQSGESGVIQYEDDFNKNIDQWVVEQQPGGQVFLGEDGLEILDSLGCTIWFKAKLKAPLRIQYEVEVIDQGGLHDRVSDLNCFWMANDPSSPDDFFKYSQSRAGKFTNYHELTLYYVGYGGHHNTKTRFRRYNGTMNRPLLPAHDLSSPAYMIQANQAIKIEISVKGNRVEYLRDNEVVFRFEDQQPYHSGFFGFRTVNNHMIVKNFRVISG